MSELVTAAQMRAIEEAAISSGAVTGLDLMERAGQGVVDAVLQEWPDLAAGAHRAVVLCGPGNNGGDGFVIARLLAARGWSVEVFFYGDADKLPPDARTNFLRWADLGVIRDFRAGMVDPDHGQLHEAPHRARNAAFEAAVHPDTGCALVVDALFGTGLSRPIRDIASETLGAANAFGSAPAPVRRVAVDLPSGLCSDSGRVLSAEPEGRRDGTVFTADLTVTFHAAKVGTVLARAPDLIGKLVVTDIGLAHDAGAAKDVARTVTAPLHPLSKLSDGRGKFGHGHALVLSGPSARTGAARLAARAALRVGAGLVTLAAPHEALAENAAQLTAVMLAEADDAAALEGLLTDQRLNALALGPGLGPDHARDLLPTVLATGRPTVLDADALTAIAGAPDALFPLLHDKCVLTPHGGEFARLFPDLSDRLGETADRGPAWSKVDATRAAAARAGCTVLFKGPATVVADQTGRCRVNAALHDRAAPWLATAGSGDVLTGLIVGLLARGWNVPAEAAATAAWLHTEAALSFGPGLIAEDLPEELPRVLRALGV